MSDKSNADRIAFLTEDQVMEVDFSDLTFDVSQQVNDFYDEVDRKIIETGQKWYFLVNYRDLQVSLTASITFAHRGKKANIAYSMGSARYSASGEMAETIQERAKFEKFDPSLYDTREAALAHLRELKSSLSQEQFAEQKVLDIASTSAEPKYEERIIFHADMEIMEADFSDLAFERSRDVNAFYDILDAKLSESGRKWYFMVNYDNFTIEPEAWVRFAIRGKDVNLTYSKGSVRFNANQSTAESIRDDASREQFDANLLPSREAAINRILEMQNAQV